MKLVLGVLLLLPTLVLANRTRYEDAAFALVVEVVAIDKASIDSATFNALSNAVEFSIWSLEERRSLPSTRVLISLIEVRLGEGHTRDLDCAILSRGTSALPILARYASATALERCTAAAEAQGVPASRVCKALDDAKRAAAELINAIKQRRRCDQ